MSVFLALQLVLIKNFAHSLGVTCDLYPTSFQIEHDPRMPAYIATQGPLSHTISDFWQVRMIYCIWKYVYKKSFLNNYLLLINQLIIFSINGFIVWFVKILRIYEKHIYPKHKVTPSKSIFAGTLVC